MSQSKKLALQIGLLFVAMMASAVEKGTIRITVLDSETRSYSTDDSGVPKNCDPTNYDAYCHSSKTAEVIYTLLVQEDGQAPFRVSCVIETKWSRCVPLEKGYSFDAKREKNGLTIYYLDDKGKLRKQLYAYVAEDKKSGPEKALAPNAVQPSAAPAPKTAQPISVVGAAGKQEEVKCSFTSTPAGAEISVDGQYIGSTPSMVNVKTGTHEVVVSMPGFAPWRRELAVSAGSEVTVNAVLQKVQ